MVSALHVVALLAGPDGGQYGNDLAEDVRENPERFIRRMGEAGRIEDGEQNKVGPGMKRLPEEGNPFGPQERRDAGGVPDRAPPGRFPKGLNQSFLAPPGGFDETKTCRRGGLRS